MLTDYHSSLKPIFEVKSIRVFAEGDESKDGQILVDRKQGKLVKVVENLDPLAYYNVFANGLGSKKQSAAIGSFDEQRRTWKTKPRNQTDKFNLQLLD